MIITANVVLILNLQLFQIKFGEAFPHIMPRTQELIQESKFNNLEELINSKENKEIFNQIKTTENSFYDAYLNVVGTTTYLAYNQYQRQPYVSNGYIGARIPNLGQGFTFDQLAPGGNKEDLSSGWPLFNQRFAGAFIAGFYDAQENTTGTNFPELLENGYESVIAAIPQWTTLQIKLSTDVSSFILDPSNPDTIGDITNYNQNLSLANGIVSTRFTWLNTLDVKYDILAHRSEPNLGLVSLQIKNLKNDTISFEIIDLLDFKSAQRCELNQVGYEEDGIYMTVEPKGVDYAYATVFSRLIADQKPTQKVNNDTIIQSINIQLQPKEFKEITKIVGIVSTDFDKNLKSPTDTINFVRSVTQSFNDKHSLFKSHNIAWSNLLNTSSISFPSDALINLGSRASLFHLMANTRPNAQGLTGAIGVGGLSSDSYAGMVFWDLDLWMFNGILPFAPEHAKSIVNYRVHTHKQAIENVPQGYHGAVYPWTSGRFGNCTATGPCIDYEYHINVAVALAAWNIYLSGAGDETYLRDVAYPLIKDAATFFANYLVNFNETLNRYTTKNLTDPDEYANHVDNGAYTNAGIASVMNWVTTISDHLSLDIPDNFTHIADNMYLPTADNYQNITLEYSGMNSSVGIKQADVIMLTYPLDNVMLDVDQAYINMEFYSMKQVSFGPAMTFPIFSIVAADLAPTGCASQSYLHKSIQPFLRGPFAQFSEQNNDIYRLNGGTHPAFPFLTAHGGFLQAILQGLTGFRFEYGIDDQARVHRMLRLDPIELPCFKKGVLFDKVYYDNHTISITVNKTSLIVENLGKVNDQANDYIEIFIGERNPQSGKYKLLDNSQMVFPLFSPYKSFPGSISECGDATFYNITGGAFGDSPFSINDGDNTTRWQNKYNDTTGKVLVDFHKPTNISSVLFNWADRPPKSLTLFKYSDTEFNQADEFFANVDFGEPDLLNEFKYASTSQRIFNQSEIFEKIHFQEVGITEPFDEDEFKQVLVPTRHNVTTLDNLNLHNCQFLLIEVDKIHNTEPIADDIGGAKLAEIVFY
ncbi:unnamed protein product [Candida verbasci]|uniref:alpha,alpha-trehalase n=1 Tax=Candida verbasci TaxID=1227364 RepID=A0A9W4X9L9_9ASCO|nr:unnamed protein product [Candida verbasci]